MPAIARNLGFAVFAFAAMAWADTHAEVVDLFASMGAALAEDNVPGFLKALDPNMPGYDTLRGQLNALVGAAEVASSIDPLKDDGDDAKRSVDLDWYLELRTRENTGPLVRRREIVHCQLQKIKGKWRVTSLAPLTLFNPITY
jgi:hypothetical protein